MNLKGRRKNKTVQEVVGWRLCTGCGTCVSVCPKSAVRLVLDNRRGIYLPKIDEEKCNLCGICYEACPGHSVDFKQLNLEVVNKESENILIGNYLGCYIGYSTDQKIRYNSTSGGLVTQLLIFALEEGIIDGVLTTKMRADRPLEPEPFIAKTREEVISASKSKYCPVPANIALKEIICQDGKFAVVGLPCHIQGVRKAEVLNKKLKEKIVLHMGLFCSHTVNFSGTELLLEKLGIKKHDVKQLNYRGRGWPGHLSIVLSNGHQVLVNFLDYWRPLFGPYFFTPLRCLCCYDLTNELADLSFGDAWLKEIMKKDKEGTSIVISRSNIGEETLRRAELEGKITINKINSEKVVESQRSPLYFKKVGLGLRMSILRSFDMGMPKYCGMEQTINPSLYVVNLLQLLDAIVSRRKTGYSLLKYMPFQVLRGWGAFLYYLELLSYRVLGGAKDEHIYS